MNQQIRIAYSDTLLQMFCPLCNAKTSNRSLQFAHLYLLWHTKLSLQAYFFYSDICICTHMCVRVSV